MIPSVAIHVLALWLAAAAQEGEQPEIVRVEREGERAPTDLTGAVTVLTSDRWEGRITSVAELLAEQAGVRVRSWGGLGSFATVSVRGSTAEQVNVYLDGIRMNQALGGGVNLADFPLENLEAIEVYRGFTPSWLPGGAIGGAINLRTRRAAGPVTSPAAASVSWGSYDTARLAARLPLAGDSVAGLLSFDGQSSSGDFTFYDNNGTPATAADDGWEQRANNEFWNAEAAGRLEIPTGPGARLDLTGSYLGRQAGVPGIDAYQSLDATTSTSRALARAAWTSEMTPRHGTALGVDLDLSASRTVQEFTDRAGQTTRGPAADTRVQMGAYGPSARLRFSAGEPGGVRHDLRALLSGRLETADQLDRLNPVRDRGRSSRSIAELSLEDEIHFAGGRLVVAPSARMEWVANDFSSEVNQAGALSSETPDDRRYEPSGRLGIAYFPAGRLSLRASAARFHRLPSFLEIFGDSGSVRGSGGDLESETGTTIDAGVGWEARPAGALRRLRLDATGFRTDADDLIQLMLVSQSQVVAANTGQARITGLELSSALALWSFFDGALNYTYQVARDHSGSFSDGSDLPGRSRHVLAVQAALTDPSGRWGRVSWNFDYVGPNWFDRAAATLGTGSGIPSDLLRAPGRYLHSLGWTRRFGERFEAALEIDNVGDIHTVDVARYPLPGRLVTGRLRIIFP